MNTSPHFKVEQDATKLRNVALFSPPVSLATTTALRLLKVKKKRMSSDTHFLLHFLKYCPLSKINRGNSCRIRQLLNKELRPLTTYLLQAIFQPSGLCFSYEKNIKKELQIKRRFAI